MQRKSGGYALRISAAIHQRLVGAVDIDVIHPVHLGQHLGQRGPAEDLPLRLHTVVIGVKIQVEHLILPGEFLENHLVRQCRLAVHIRRNLLKLLHQLRDDTVRVLSLGPVGLGRQAGGGGIQIIHQVLPLLQRLLLVRHRLTASQQQSGQSPQDQAKILHRPRPSAHFSHGLASCLTI